MKNVLVNGAAGFIGFHLSYGLLENGYCVVGLDNLNEYYNISLKRDRLIHLEYKSGFTFQKLDLANRQAIAQLFEDEKFDVVVNLVGQASMCSSLQIISIAI